MKSKENMYDDKYRLFKWQGYDYLPREAVLELMDAYIDEHLSYACEEGTKWGIGNWCVMCKRSDKCPFFNEEKKRINLELQLDELKS
jgi:hypothetical protein